MSKKKKNSYVKVNTTYLNSGDYLVWTGRKLLIYGKAGAWSLGKEQDYTQIFESSFGVKSKKISLPNMLKKVL